jgi:hypothetical protein
MSDEQQTRVALPHLVPGEDTALLVGRIDSWLACDALEELVGAFGGRCAGLSGRQRADFLEEFAARNWDYRQGQERNLAQAASLSAEQEQLALVVAERLQMIGSSPPSRDHYDVVLILGGLVRACLVRSRYAKELLANGLRTDLIVALGSFRPLGGDEIALAGRLGLSGGDELEVMTVSMERAFGVEQGWKDRGAVDAMTNERWMVRSAKDSRPHMQVIAAPSSEPYRRRANTLDTYRFLVGQVPEQVRTVLVVTNPIYVPYQGCVALQVFALEQGWTVETVGAGASASDLGGMTQPFGTQHYLQEIRSAISSMRSLRCAASEGRRRPAHA